MNVEQLARATVAVLWVDERDTLEEWAAAERIFTDNGVDWEKAKPLIEEELEALIDESTWRVKKRKEPPSHSLSAPPSIKSFLYRIERSRFVVCPRHLLSPRFHFYHLLLWYDYGTRLDLGRGEFARQCHNAFARAHDQLQRRQLGLSVCALDVTSNGVERFLYVLEC